MQSARHPPHSSSEAEITHRRGGRAFSAFKSVAAESQPPLTCFNRLCSIPIPLAGRHGNTQTNKPLDRDD